ncbi:GTP-dependent dephospho-CoA kinase family protein [Halorientalis litorea]|uniref:GTP-dependent dephospho-CoA kinase family protein n=1 Tax=Halorientalis litorea TaxID=2931977 RepID=UPI001FF242A7|nr:GTP-dependent dephospho-CoA kinase family protein [Halorientalis litorea]
MTDEPDETATGDTADDEEPSADVVVTLQQSLRGELKEPFGPLYTDAETLLADADDPLVAVGDIVTYHLVRAGQVPDVALVDGHTKRSTVEDHVQEAIDSGVFDREVRVPNPPATLSADLLTALRDALDADGSTVVVVDGEEDLGALPAIVAAPDAASVVYGQPDEGMVLVTCDAETVDVVRDLLTRMDGDTGRLWGLLGLAD